MNYLIGARKRKEKALVCLSGGQDSTTALAWAKEVWGDKVEAVSFDYGQTHSIELESAKKIAQLAGVRHHVVKVSCLTYIRDTALTSDVEIKMNKKGLPNTFVPSRNFIFAGIAASIAYRRGISNLVLGVSQTDYSNYPDCRDDSMAAIQLALTHCLDMEFTVHTPMMWLSKGEEVLLMKQLGKISWLKFTHTCYRNKRPACGVCPACELRIKGFKEAGIIDPIPYEIEIDWSGCVDSKYYEDDEWHQSAARVETSKRNSAWR